MTPIVLCGGSGSRLWPLSRTLYPKQFLKVLGERSLLQETVLRLPQNLGCISARGYVISNQEHRFLVAEQLREIQAQQFQIILEPVGRNTAAAIAVATLKCFQENPTQTVLILSADHVIHDASSFAQALAAAKVAAEAGAIVTFGVEPTSPETGYGYIHADKSGQGALKVLAFVEKPNIATAQKYVADGDYYWNSGIFAFRADVMLEQLKLHAPDILAQCEKSLADSEQDKDLIWLNKEAFEACRSDSIDYAVMEKTQLAKVVPFAGGWNDVGSWAAIWDESPKDQNNNAIAGDVVIQDVRNSYIHAENRLVGVVGVEDLVVVETSDAVLITKRQVSQKVKELVDHLKTHQRQEGHHHQLVHRPWGSYESFSQGAHYQVKRLIVKPQARISVQYHHHRSEHWVVISGTAKVRVGDQYLTLSENQSIFIPVGVVHSLENPGDSDLEVIEVQSGTYLGEDDIVRLEDRYGRA